MQTDRSCKIHCQQERIDAPLVELFLEARAEAPKRVVLEANVTDLPLHGWQEDRFSKG